MTILDAPAPVAEVPPHLAPEVLAYYAPAARGFYRHVTDFKRSEEYERLRQETVARWKALEGQCVTVPATSATRPGQRAEIVYVGDLGARLRFADGTMAGYFPLSQLALAGE